jgi:hypothetical protein
MNANSILDKYCCFFKLKALSKKQLQAHDGFLKKKMQSLNSRFKKEWLLLLVVFQCGVNNSAYRSEANMELQRKF